MACGCHFSSVIISSHVGIQLYECNMIIPIMRINSKCNRVGWGVLCRIGIHYRGACVSNMSWCRCITIRFFYYDEKYEMDVLIYELLM